MNIKKALAIGIIALFIGISFAPINGATIEEKESRIPIQISSISADGKLGTQTISLSESEIISLIDLVDSMKKPGRHPGDLWDRLRDLFNLDDGTLGDIGLLSKLPGNPIVSIGEGRELISRYHGRVQFKKLIGVWNYPGNNGATIIWGDGLTSVPTQILLQKQIGIMFGFVGVYVYIPPILEKMNSKTCFIGSALFAWGLSA
jgi:hypothetical protein